MVQRLSWDEVLLSTLTEPSLMEVCGRRQGYDVSLPIEGKSAGLAKDPDDRTGNRRNDEQKHHHGDRAVLILIVKGRSEKPVSAQSLRKTSRLFELGSRASGDSFALSDITSHETTRGAGVIALANPPPSTSLIHRWQPNPSMQRHEFELDGRRIHLAVEGSTGGTSVGLHAAADTINKGKRVLWASVDMPDPARFSQLFSHLSLVESSRFHAMNFGGKFERAMDALLEAANSLPSVGLVVLDDWCANTGRISSLHLEQVERLVGGVPENMTVLLISKGSVDASGTTTEPIVARAAERMSTMGFQVWRLWRGERQQHRILKTESEALALTLDDSGFHR